MPHEKQTVHSVIELLPAEIGTLEQAIGYRFRSREILAQALTHSSLAHEQQAKGLSCRCNERYEFLGDSILSVLTSTYIFSLFPDAPEGDRTKLRATMPAPFLWATIFCSATGKKKTAAENANPSSPMPLRRCLPQCILTAIPLGRYSAF